MKGILSYLAYISITVLIDCSFAKVIPKRIYGFEFMIGEPELFY